MASIPAEVNNARREEIWHLFLKGYNPQSIKRELNMTNPTLYRDINFLTEESKKFMYSMAKGTHVLMYKKAIDGTNLALTEAWNKFHNPEILEKPKLGYLRLIGDFNKSLMELTINGPSVMAIEDLRKKIENAGINVDLNLNNIGGETDRTDKYDSPQNNIN